MEKLIIEKYTKGNISLEELSKEFKFGKLKLKKILMDNNIPINSRGGQSKYNHKNIKPNIDPHILECKKCGKKFNDYENKSGSITNHIKECFPNIEIPTSFKRRMHLKEFGEHFHIQFFNKIDVIESHKLKCLQCGWETFDINNKTGSLTKHIEKTHGQISEYLINHPEHNFLFNTFKTQIERNELFSNDENFVTCKICDEQFKTITNTHLQLHNTTTNDYKLKFGKDSLISETTKNEFIDNLKNVDVSFYYRSKSEIEIENFIKSLGINVIVCDKKVLNVTEIDLYLTDYNLAIEYNGLYWHSEKRGKTKKYHLDKTIKCKNKGIKLIHIFSDEWLTKKEIIKNRLRNLIGLNENKIQARKCEIVEINKEEKSLFLKSNHLQGNDKSTIYLGLKYKNNLVGLMTFGKLRKVLGSKDEKDTYELYRYCSLNVVGGFSKLLKHFIKTCSPKKIITYANRNWTPFDEFSFYSKVGFSYVGNTEPNYSYTKKYDIREHRFNFRKDKLIKLGYDKNKTENQIMFEIGYDKIWDTGNLKYELIIK
jgi:hypothetical protein